MARIDEERILIRVSILIRDDSNVNVTTLLTSNTILATEEYVSSLVDGLAEGVIVEATNITGSTIIIPPTYAISVSSNVVNEGNSVSFTVTTTNITSGTSLYWTNAGTANAADFTGNVNSGSVFINNNLGIISVAATADNTIEGPETIVIQLRTDGVTGPIVALSQTVTVSDTSV